MTNKTKQNRKKRDNNSEDDEYVYPTKKGREHKTRDRRSSKNLIKRGLIDHEYGDPEDTPMSDLVEDQAIMDDYNDMIYEFNHPIDDDYEDDWYDDSPMREPDDYDSTLYSYTYPNDEGDH